MDIISELEKMDIHVDFVEDKVYKGDPYYLRASKSDMAEGGEIAFFIEAKDRWVALLNRLEYQKSYDYLLVIDGLSFHPYLVEELKKRNRGIRVVNYLYDSTYSLYKFHNNFQYFDFVASFDKKDCKTYNISFLPIYWKNVSSVEDKGIDVFGLGGYNKVRLNLYKTIEEISKRCGMTSYLKLYSPQFKHFLIYSIGYIVKKIIGEKTHIPPLDYLSRMAIHTIMPADEYVRMVSSAKIVVDSVAFEQDGMTARFMWALGLGKKIITNNTNIKSYDCYTKEQVYVVDDVEKIDRQELLCFMKSPYNQPENIKCILKKWRLDNWIKYLLNV